MDSDLIFGKTWEQIQDMQQGRYVAPVITDRSGKDYGADPLGDGTFRMVPSGDIVNWEERCKRLGKTIMSGRSWPPSV